MINVLTALKVNPSKAILLIKPFISIIKATVFGSVLYSFYIYFIQEFKFLIIMKKQIPLKTWLSFLNVICLCKTDFAADITAINDIMTSNYRKYECFWIWYDKKIVLLLL
jgi:hypothetical protein